MPSPELWGECKVVCADCPDKTDRTAKKTCQHPWRGEVERRMEESQDGSAPFDTPEVCKALGATVSSHLLGDGKRPSFQIYAVEPVDKHAYVKVIIRNSN